MASKDLAGLAWQSSTYQPPRAKGGHTTRNCASRALSSAGEHPATAACILQIGGKPGPARAPQSPHSTARRIRIPTPRVFANCRFAVPLLRGRRAGKHMWRAGPADGRSGSKATGFTADVFCRKHCSFKTTTTSAWLPRGDECSFVLAGLCTLHFARSSRRLRSYKDMGDRWDLIKVHYLYRIGYSSVVESAILANQRHHAKCLLKEILHD